MKITKTITIDLARAPDHPRILAVEGDSGSRAVQIRLKANLEPWSVPEGVEASLVYQKPDGTSGWYDTLPDGAAACAMEGNIITLELAPQVLTVEGTVSAALVLRDGAGNQITTFPFYIQVLSRPGDTETSRDYYNLKVVASIEELTARLEALEKQGGGGSGTNGKSAYEYAREAGYDGTEEEFAQKLAEDAPTKLSQLANDLISGATVGQVARITAVDENGVPTAWEAVDLAGGDEVWETIIDYTVPEDCVEVLLKTDIDGNPFQLKKAIMTFLIMPIADPANVPSIRYGFESTISGVYAAAQMAYAINNPPRNAGKCTAIRFICTKQNNGVTVLASQSGASEISIGEQFSISGFGGTQMYYQDTLRPVIQTISAAGVGSYATAIGAGTRIVVVGVRE